MTITRRAFVLVVVDCAALAFAHAVTSLSAVSTLLLTVSVLGFNAAAGIYTTRWPPRTEIALVAACALAAACVTTGIRGLFSLATNQGGPIVAAGVFLLTATIARTVIHLVKPRLEYPIGSRVIS